jgi:hypothetical protein
MTGTLRRFYRLFMSRVDITPRDLQEPYRVEVGKGVKVLRLYALCLERLAIDPVQNIALTSRIALFNGVVKDRINEFLRALLESLGQKHINAQSGLF